MSCKESMIKRKDYEAFMRIKQAMVNNCDFDVPDKIVFIVRDEELQLLQMCANSLENRLAVMKRALALFEQPKQLLD